MAHGMWRFGRNSERCCIYRVPKCLRDVNPEAYTPQLVLIGPLHHYLKARAQVQAQAQAEAQPQDQAPTQDQDQDQGQGQGQGQGHAHGDITNTKSMGYLNMVTHKTHYLEAFSQRFGGQNTIEAFRGMIEQEEDRIREHYSESTDWIKPPEFVEMILNDSVFILEFLLRSHQKRRNRVKIGDPLMDEPCLQSTIRRDLILLENQLPYFILETLFELISRMLVPILEITLRELIRSCLGVHHIIDDNSPFHHFTDLLRCIRVNTLSPNQRVRHDDPIIHIYNADKLNSVGVKLKAAEEDHSLDVKFENDCLEIPQFSVDGNMEVTLRNIMALEQCHYPFDAYVCNYIIFLDSLIDTVKDVDFLVEKGIISSRIGNHDVVAKIVNKLCLGVVEYGSYNSGIATQVINHYVDLERMSQNMDLESGRSGGMWLFPTSFEHCCIYRVPNSIRRLDPEAYTPRLVIIGPLHHSLKAQARKTRGDITNTELIGYLNMEKHKRIYVQNFNERVPRENDAINVIRGLIEHDEVRIRQSYSESTDWIQSPEFVDMILHDSIFIMELLLSAFERKQIAFRDRARTGDHVLDEPCLEGMIRRDLGLLENQLPYFILQSLFDFISPSIRPIPRTGYRRFRELTISYFNVNEIQDGSEFRHFTDLLRCIRSESLTGLPPPGNPNQIITHMYNAEKLHRRGVRLRKVGGKHSLVVKFRKPWYWWTGYLEIPCFSVEGHLMVKLRNIMALEQCHYPSQAYVCSYIIFLDYLIDTEKDIDLLVEKGIIIKMIGDNSSLADSVNKLCVGIYDYGSYHSDVARAINQHCDYWCIWTCATLFDVYFNNCWRTTATLAAVIIVLMTIGSFVTSLIQVVT